MPPSPAVEAPSTLAVDTADNENASAPEPIVSAEEVESWKAEYDSQVQAWRAESAEAREKAETERQRWETVRANQVQAPSVMSGWETVGSKNTSSAPSGSVHTSSIADSRDLVSGEPQASRAGPSHSQASGDDAAKWEDVPSSISSSFPSMSFPEHDETSPATRKPPTDAPMSATLAIFDPSLSSRTRVKALFSSLAINLLLPFINGVMLGFGEIFAKNIVLEWWRPGSTVTQTGIRRRRRT
ncbi:hypothetical protein BDZ89DRAFT_1058387 [Hymenopellis radicata]|nr:hypothetical protein BDZ89DRAFT_1058387 [Hymenopellis radicata]